MNTSIQMLFCAVIFSAFLFPGPVDAGSKVSKVVGPEGGTIKLTNVGSITFSSGAFQTEQTVMLAKTTRQETQADFLATAKIFGVGERMPYELRITASSAPPQNSFIVTLDIPEDFLAQVPTDSEVQVFAQIFEDGGEEILDSFELFPSSVSLTEKTITVTLPKEAFTNRRTLDETFEAIVLLATTPTKP